MVFLALTPQGLIEAMQTAEPSAHPVWCGAQAITEEEYSRVEGTNLSRFNYEIDARDHQQLLGALEAIAEHHPGHSIWVEAASNEA